MGSPHATSRTAPSMTATDSVEASQNRRQGCLTADERVTCGIRRQDLLLVIGFASSRVSPLFASLIASTEPRCWVDRPVSHRPATAQSRSWCSRPGHLRSLIALSAEVATLSQTVVTRMVSFADSSFSESGLNIGKFGRSTTKPARECRFACLR